MSSAFGDWKVNSSFLTVTKVNVCEKALLLLKIIDIYNCSVYGMAGGSIRPVVVGRGLATL